MIRTGNSVVQCTTFTDGTAAELLRAAADYVEAHFPQAINVEMVQDCEDGSYSLSLYTDWINDVTIPLVETALPLLKEELRQPKELHG